MNQAFKAIGAVFLLIVLTMCVSMNTNQASKPSNNMEETCKDWIYSRNQIIKYTREGNTAAANKARASMRAFGKDLQQWPDNVVSETINQIEASGYKAGLQ